MRCKFQCNYTVNKIKGHHVWLVPVSAVHGETAEHVVRVPAFTGVHGRCRDFNSRLLKYKKKCASQANINDFFFKLKCYVKRNVYWDIKGDQISFSAQKMEKMSIESLIFFCHADSSLKTKPQESFINKLNIGDIAFTSTLFADKSIFQKPIAFTNEWKVLMILSPFKSD